MEKDFIDKLQSLLINRKHINFMYELSELCNNYNYDMIDIIIMFGL